MLVYSKLFVFIEHYFPNDAGNSSLADPKGLGSILSQFHAVGHNNNLVTIIGWCPTLLGVGTLSPSGKILDPRLFNIVDLKC